MEDNPRRSVRRGHLVALAALLSVLVASSLANQHWIGIQRDDARAIMLAGRHRMLIQRLAFTSLLLQESAEAGDAVQVASVRDFLAESLEQLGSEHGRLFHAVQAVEEEQASLEDTEADDPDPGHRVDARFHAFLHRVERLVAASGDVRAEEIGILRGEATVLLEDLDDIVARIEDANEAGLERLHNLQFVFLGIEMALLLGLAVFLIRPMEERLRSQFQDLRSLNRRLEERNAAAVRTREELRELSLALSNAMPGISRLDAEGAFVHVNGSLAEMLGHEPGDLLGRPWDTILHPLERGLASTARQRARETGKYELEARVVRRDGSELYGLFLLVERRDERGDPIGHHCFLRDVSKRRGMEERLRHDASHDPLTGLPNRTLLRERLEHGNSAAGRRREDAFAVLFLDLDRFKLINDGYGHEIGDRLLVEVARSLEDAVRPGDTVARLGGDEFAILLDDARDARDVITVARRILRQFRRPFEVDGKELFTNASIGVALGLPGKVNPGELLREADTAMYQAKRRGSGCVAVFQQDMHARVMADLQVETDLRRAVERDELRLHYQPIVSLEDGRIVAFEALLRWQHPRRGMLLPREFLAIAEDTDLIEPIGSWVLGEACRQVRVWKERHPASRDLAVNVNLSGKHFKFGRLFERLDELLDGFDPRSLNLELTEGTLLNHKEVSDLLEPVVARGIETEIDDFGTGYSSLSNLHRLPIRGLKIDRSFVDRIGTRSSAEGIVCAIVALADAMGMRVTAEGVENEDQLDYLRAAGCTRAQGYLISRPLPPEQAEALLSSPVGVRAPSSRTNGVLPRGEIRPSRRRERSDTW